MFPFVSDVNYPTLTRESADRPGLGSFWPGFVLTYNIDTLSVNSSMCPVHVLAPHHSGVLDIC